MSTVNQQSPSEHEAYTRGYCDCLHKVISLFRPRDMKNNESVSDAYIRFVRARIMLMQEYAMIRGVQHLVDDPTSAPMPGEGNDKIGYPEPK